MKIDPAASLSDKSAPTVAIIIASLGRPDILGELLDDLANQSRPADRIILSVTCKADLPPDAAARPTVETIIGPIGSCVQRNRGIDHIGDRCDILFFCDDDYVPSRFAIERIAALFGANPNLAGTTGHLLADGVNSPGIGAQEARVMLDDYDRRPAAPSTVYRDLAGLYGCNMAFRSLAIKDVRFDERLRLYGWQEDIDFSVRIRPRGRIAKSFAFAGVHRGVKAGRSRGVRIGYSQVVNPAYLVRKGTMDWRYACNIVLRNFFANHLRSLGAEPWVDRIGRVRGNWIGVGDVLRGRLTPERVESL
ncbi:glycosyltransferase [Sphingomonas sp.]|uniref:glycosyltransferase family 2 protein n=1 Tax=Sphingomonas sp. TaxID=28214 RepID=UPI0025F7107D|nr:glycosyltransferase [Sphingomonas sp.]